MEILVSNDDGYASEGIHALCRVAASLGNLTVVAPKYHQSGKSLAVSIGLKQLAYKQLPKEGPGKWSYLDATPATCVKFALQYFFGAKLPDLVVSGINHGNNASIAANYSATLGAAKEATLHGIRAVGVSLDNYSPHADFSAVEAMLPDILKTLLHNWPGRDGVYYNVNFPNLSREKIRGVRFARQSKGHWVNEFEPWNEERLSELGLAGVFLWRERHITLEEGEESYFMNGEFICDEAQDDETSDYALLQKGWVTIVPMHCDTTDSLELKRLGRLP